MNLRWKLEQLKEYYELLKAIRDLEEKVGCPCPEERDKPDYLKLIKEAIDKEIALREAEKPKCKCTVCGCKK